MQPSHADSLFTLAMWLARTGCDSEALELFDAEAARLAQPAMPH
jgi:hypothetical protein